jgi:ADP-ribose pyrophosphatase YjhB (NUDIX family)
MNVKNDILLVSEKKEVNRNKLNLPGGHLEIGESPME